MSITLDDVDGPASTAAESGVLPGALVPAHHGGATVEVGAVLIKNYSSFEKYVKKFHMVFLELGGCYMAPI